MSNQMFINGSVDHSIGEGDTNPFRLGEKGAVLRSNDVHKTQLLMAARRAIASGRATTAELELVRGVDEKLARAAAARRAQRNNDVEIF